ncbi:polyprenol phosphomannose-dependent alpha 1,6 mannosyltransferase MptB [Nocardioides sp. AE5]|uniref:polyprenol phosphomannose-dependent alpha 1,6 mannosyltransferase MptB n=1 Tax=Nocardioides sp. AE5 TaxID=2962573 RepID=UPI00288122B5|nr:polyprenol phosphomannose-dependent alpha 1,6 mannosyltransferase MptB [Nocardioides sp. AE5]MDT0200719.1 polyprenol phosphomannose-dependent alpha 1,6 mannosyltransferase MptB [Nocardioides sp. AE5]
METPDEPARSAGGLILRGVVGSLLVLLGGLVVSPLPRSARILDLAWLVDLRDANPGRYAATFAVMLGVALLAHSWLMLCRHVSAVGRATGEAVGLVQRATLIWSAPLMLAPPLFSRDGWSYAAQGMMTSVGLSPYDSGPAVLHGPIVETVDPLWLATPTPYGPLPLIFGDLAARITTDPWALVMLHRCAAVVGLVLLAWAVPRMARWSGVNPALSAGIVIASPLMLTTGVGGLHNDLLMVGLMSAALVVAAERNWCAAAVLGGLAAAVKVPGGLICIAVALVSLPVAASLWERVRRLVAVGAISLATLAGLGLVWGLGIGWLEALTVPGTVNTPLSAATVLGKALDSAAAAVGLDLAPELFIGVVRDLATVATVVVMAWVALRWRTGDRYDAIRAAVVIVATLLLLSPVVHLWYFLWLVPFVAVLRMTRFGIVLLLVLTGLAGLIAPFDPTMRSLLGTTTIAVGCLALTLLNFLRPGPREVFVEIAESEEVPA